jgi:signal transduction histidine kinase
MKLDFAFVLEQAGWPAFLVDDSGMIRRANQSAVQVLGNIMESEPSLAASIWTNENPWTAEEFLSHLEKSSLTETQLTFRTRGGTTACFSTYVCPFHKEGNKYRLFQLFPHIPHLQPETAPPAAVTTTPTTPITAPAATPAATVDTNTAQKQKLDCALQLIRTVSLDFNNALTTILGHSSLILSRLEPGHPWRNALLQIERSAEKGAEIAQDLADFSRPEKDARAQAPGNLNAVLRNTVDLFQGANQAGITWNVQLEKRLYTVTFDEAKIQQALSRVIENAIEAVQNQGEITVRTLNHSFNEPVTTTHLRLAAGHYVCIEVADNGCGINREDQIRVFEPFFTTKNNPKHRGLGLAWVYGIITNHGGVVSLTSEPQKGTLVRLFLPAQQKIVRDQSTKVDDLRGSETILVVDDEEMLLNMGQTILSAFGYKVLTANNGQRALDLFQSSNTPIDLVVTDLVMPGMSGRELTERLRRLAPNVPILATSGYVRPQGSSEEEAYLRKPFTSQELLRKVRQTLSPPQNHDA